MVGIIKGAITNGTYVYGNSSANFIIKLEKISLR